MEKMDLKINDKVLFEESIILLSGKNFVVENIENYNTKKDKIKRYYLRNLNQDEIILLEVLNDIKFRYFEQLDSFMFDDGFYSIIGLPVFGYVHPRLSKDENDMILYNIIENSIKEKVSMIENGEEQEADRYIGEIVSNKKIQWIYQREETEFLPILFLVEIEQESIIEKEFKIFEGYSINKDEIFILKENK